MFEKGNIIIGKGYGTNHAEAFHPIIYLEGDTNNDFLGLMLTTSTKWSNNFPLKKEHFIDTDVNGKPFLIKYDNSHCVFLRLIKRADWNPFTKAGQLTSEGIRFVEENTKELSPIYWDVYKLTIQK